jgi:hypothetical protein
MAKYTKRLRKQTLPPSKWFREQEDDDKANLKLVFRWMAQVRGLSVRDLDTMWGEEGEGADKVVALLPSDVIHSKDIRPTVSEYATKNYKELFAESFAFRATGKELPKSVSALLDKSIPVARNALEKGASGESADEE